MNNIIIVKSIQLSKTSDGGKACDRVAFYGFEKANQRIAVIREKPGVFGWISRPWLSRFLYTRCEVVVGTTSERAVIWINKNSLVQRLGSDQLKGTQKSSEIADALPPKNFVISQDKNPMFVLQNSDQSLSFIECNTKKSRPGYEKLGEGGSKTAKPTTEAGLLVTVARSFDTSIFGKRTCKFRKKAELNAWRDGIKKEIKIHEELCEDGNPHIVKLVASVHREGITQKNGKKTRGLEKFYFLLERCDGDLFDFLDEIELNREQIAEEMVHAVAYMHEKNYVHRDLKLENFLLSRVGHAKLSDFGGAYKMRSHPPSNNYSGTTYRAPEQFGPKTDHDWAKIDAFTLWLALYHLYTGKYDLNDKCSFKSKIAPTQEMIDRAVDQVPEKHREIVRGLLRLDPSHRMTVAEAAKHLKDLKTA
jgi:hypothetical protein